MKWSCFPNASRLVRNSANASLLRRFRQNNTLSPKEMGGNRKIHCVKSSSAILPPFPLWAGKTRFYGPPVSWRDLLSCVTPYPRTSTTTARRLSKKHLCRKCQVCSRDLVKLQGNHEEASSHNGVHRSVSIWAAVVSWLEYLKVKYQRVGNSVHVKCWIKLRSEKCLLEVLKSSMSTRGGKNLYLKVWILV